MRTSFKTQLWLCAILGVAYFGITVYNLVQAKLLATDVEALAETVRQWSEEMQLHGE